MPSTDFTTDIVVRKFSGLRNLAHTNTLVGPYRAPRGTLLPGVVTRREWLRFLSYVEQGPLCSCNERQHNVWTWQGHTNPYGYGRFSWRGRDYMAHRFAYLALRGVIPDGQEPDHLCQQPSCCDPWCLGLSRKE